MNVTVFFNPLDAKSKQDFEVEPGTPVIDFLQSEFPAGFGCPVRVFYGIDEVDPDNWDTPIPKDLRVVILVMPAVTGSALAGYVIKALIAVAIGYVINLIFAPKAPGEFDQGDESPVYSIGATKNAARLGSPIEVSYGTVVWPPSYGAAPYVFNHEETNLQYVDELLCLGQGYFDIDDILVGNMSYRDLEPGSVKFWYFAPNQHNQTLGIIEAIVNADVADSECPLPFYENMYTSPEIQDYEFRDGVTEATASLAIDGKVVSQGTDSEGNVIAGRLDGITRTLLLIPEQTEGGTKLAVKPGDEITLTGTTSNNITFIVDAVTDNGTTVNIFQKYDAPIPFVDEDPINPAATIAVNTTIPNHIAGPYRAQRSGDVITEAWVDITFPRGLFHRDGTNGDIKDASVTLNLNFQKILSDGSPDGAPVNFNYKMVAKTMNPHRVSISSGALTPGEYEVTVGRVGPFDDQRTTENTSWTGLRGAIQLDPGQTVYRNTTMLAIRLKATNALGSAARERVRVKATRVLDDPSSDSANPITVIKDIWTNQNYGLQRPLGELDLTWLDYLESVWVGPQAPRFNGTFDSKSTGFDAMETVAALNGSKIVQDGGLLTVIPDHIQDIRTAVFSSANIIKDTMTILYTFNTDGEYDGMTVEWRDPDTFDVRYSSYPTDPSNAETYNLFGCTDQTYAEQFARYLWNVRGRRRKRVEFDTEMEGLIPRFGDRIGVSHPIPAWGQSGVFVQQIDATSWYVDQALEWTSNNVLMLRTELGTASEMYDVSQGATPNIVVFAIVPTETIYTADTQEPTNYIFGESDDLISDFIVQSVSPRDENIMHVIGQTYDTEIYTGAPPHMRNETGPSYYDTLLAITTRLQGSGNYGSGFWAGDDPTGSLTIADHTTNGHQMNRQTGTAQFEQTGMLDDGRTSFWANGGIYYANFAAAWDISLEGCIGTSFNRRDSGSLGIIGAEWYALQGQRTRIMISYDSSAQPPDPSDMIIKMVSPGGSSDVVTKIYQNVLPAWTKQCIYINYKIVGQDFWIYPYVNFVALDPFIGTFATTALFTGPTGIQYPLGGGGATSAVFQYGFYHTEQLSATDINFLKQAWEYEVT
jgi:hypothetical protein